jgi:hypothetical protein
MRTSLAALPIIRRRAAGYTFEKHELCGRLPQKSAAPERRRHPIPLRARLGTHSRAFTRRRGGDADARFAVKPLSRLCPEGSELAMIARVLALCSIMLFAASAAAQPPPSPPSAPEGAGARVFCGQSVALALAPRSRIPARYRRFFGIWSDAAWGPGACAALVVESIDRAGTARILYVYGPLSSDTPGPGGVLRGTGIIRGGALRFQNSDGTQFVFRPQGVDLAGAMTTPRGERFAATFKKSF